MSPSSVGLAEVDHRLRSLRRRLNLFALAEVVCIGLGVAVLVSAALVLVALRGSPAAFRPASAAAVLLVVAVGIGSALHVRRRWMDLRTTAHIADHRGRLLDRLATLVDLQDHPRPSPMAALLVEQTLALGGQWHHRAIHPRRFPRSAYVLAAALLVLASTLFIAPHLPPPSAATARKEPDRRGESPSPRAPSMRVAHEAGPAPGAGAAEPVDPEQEGQPDSELAASGEKKGTGSDEGSGRLLQLAKLSTVPDHLQEAIRKAFSAEPLDKPRLLAGQPQGSVDANEPQASEKGQHTTARTAMGNASDTDEAGRSSVPAKLEDHGQRPPGKTQGSPEEPQAAESRPEGASSGAGSGSSPGELLGGRVTETATIGGETKTFRVTITSFLHGTRPKAPPPVEKGKRVVTTGAAARGADTDLNERQLSDDLLRKAEIPPEYEDIVRRVYSTRAVQ